VPPDAPPNWWLLGGYGLLQLGRLWIIVSLGAHWTTRVIVHPGARHVRRGPYSFLRHPNYLVVAVEIPLLPLVFGAWQIALGFGLANLALLVHRIRVEDRALAES
jgi:methyltransferase